MKFSAATFVLSSSTLFGVALSSDGDAGGQFYIKHKLGSNKVQKDGVSDNDQIGVKIVGGDESQVGEFPYYGTSMLSKQKSHCFFHNLRLTGCSITQQRHS